VKPFLLLFALLVAAPVVAAPRAAWPWRTEAVAAAPAPDDTLFITATEPYQGTAGTGRAYVALAPGHAALTRPIIVIEGFDIDNAMGWDELYALLNQENLLEDLRARGYDAVVLDFTDATDAIQRNAFVFTQLLGEVETAIDPEQTVDVVGASMGGLVGRYGLAWLEKNAVPHRVRTFLSYDAPHLGANIPLGLQYWVDFFSSQSTAAAYFRDRINTPAARQMLAYHFTSPPSSSPAADPLHAALASDLADVGSWPAQPRLVGFSNGSGAGGDQGYGPGAQLIQYSYNNFLATILGNVWAVPNGGPVKIFDGRIRILFSDSQRAVTVNGTLPYDNAPGGWRASLAQLDTTQAPFGDIVALHDAHCFVPTVSALDVPTNDLFATAFDGSPFDAVYTAPSNEEHVHISPAEKEAILAELDPPVAVTPDVTVPRLAILSAAPNPSASAVRLMFAAPSAGSCDARIFAANGRLVRAFPSLKPGTFTWDGRDDHGTLAPAGLYFVRIAQGASAATARLVRLN